MNKKEYIKPNLKIIKFDNYDILCTSQINKDKDNKPSLEDSNPWEELK